MAFAAELKTVALRDDGCFSVLLFNNRPVAVTVEHTFEDGRVAIKAGDWLCKRGFFHRGGYETFEIFIPDHSRILFHKGNTETDSEGCVLVGGAYGMLSGKAAVLGSKLAFENMMLLLRHEDLFTLTVSGR